MTRSKCLLVMAALPGWAAWLLLEYVPQYSDGSLCIGCISIAIVLTLAAFVSQKWTAFAAFSLLLVVSTVGGRWRYVLAVAVLTSWLAMHLLNFVSGIADWLERRMSPCRTCQCPVGANQERMESARDLFSHLGVDVPSRVWPNTTKRVASGDGISDLCLADRRISI
jgi:hypothetical protein